MKWSRARRVLGRAAAAGAVTGLIALAAAILWPVDVPSFAAVRAAYTPSDAWLLDRHGTVIDARRIRMDVRRLAWVPLDAVSPALVAALIDDEDRRFWQHHGIDWQAVAAAVRAHLLSRRPRGASTITMQLASLLEHRHETRGLGAWLGKIEQMRTARSLEAHWNKRQILEAYLNLLEYRGELQGIGAAAAVLADRSPAALTIAESEVLAALLPQPDSPERRVVARACARVRANHLAVGCAAIRAAADTLLTHRGNAEPVHLVPQLAAELLERPGERLVTTLDAGVERRAVDIVRGHLDALAGHNARDGAALIVDNASGDVLAYVASGGPKSRAAEVDGVRALRQAGSTLKPFLYEMAFERRYLTAASLLADAPLSLDTASGVYVPQDYDHDFKGLVSARTALASSLNVPAVRTLVLVGVEAFREQLRALGYAGIKRDGEYYGYSLALGSAEVTLWQQAQAYRALARGGAWSPLTLVPAAAPASDAPRDTHPMRPGATFIVDDILGDPAARAVTFGLDNHLDTSIWTAVKTGTSEDMRDNWCIGFSREYTVAVWVGNFEGDSMRAVSGVSGAAPIWHDLVAMMQRGVASEEPRPPAGVHALNTAFSPAVEPPRREWFLGGTRIPGGTVVAVPARARPRIASPANGMIIALDPDIPPAHQRVLIALKGAGPSMRLKLNDRIWEHARAQTLWAPRPGAYRLTLQGARGRILDRVFFTVRGTPGSR